VNSKEYIQSGIVEAYVLGLATQQERAELEQLMLQHPEIKDAITTFEENVEKAAFANAIAPKKVVKENLQQLLQSEFATETPVVTMPTSTTISNKAVIKPIFSKQWAVAAAILLIISAALNVYFYGKYKDANKQVYALLNQKNSLQANNENMQVKYLELFNNLQLATDSSMIKVVMPGVKGLEQNMATVFWDKKTKDVYMMANKLPAAPAGMQYQLWALVDGKPVDAGVMGECNGMCKLKNIKQAQAFAVTLEKEGGSPTPNLAALQVLGKVG
jgi:anti-sigma-K factor RskA